MAKNVASVFIGQAAPTGKQSESVYCGTPAAAKGVGQTSVFIGTAATATTAASAGGRSVLGSQLTAGMQSTYAPPASSSTVASGGQTTGTKGGRSAPGSQSTGELQSVPTVVSPENSSRSGANSLSMPATQSVHIPLGVVPATGSVAAQATQSATEMQPAVVATGTASIATGSQAKAT